ncbi:hypothetical protein GW17_00010013 [Ensete ventricosum]|nr:hypothetical protein GW17_00010013 [Ensete ventricosum]
MGGTYGPPGYRYADRLLPGSFAKNRSSTVDFDRRWPIEEEIDRRRSIEREIDRRRSIEEERGKKKRKRRKKEEEKKEYLAGASLPPIGRPRVVRPQVARGCFFSRVRTRSVSPHGEKDRGDVTPCDHCFHSGCLQRWMDIKMECPTCRRSLPPA